MAKKKYKVYFLKSHEGHIIYVGVTGKNTEDRFKEHAETKYWIDDVSEVDEVVIENSAQSRITELLYINTFKPLFNIKDKYEGKIYTSIRSKEKLINHSFFAINGKPTNSIPYFKEDYVLVGTVNINNIDIGLYYDFNMNMYCSLDNLCDAYKIKTIGFKNKSPLVKKVSYQVSVNGSSKTKYEHLCKYEYIESIVTAKKDITELTNIFKLCDIRFNKNNEEANEILKTFIYAFENLNNKTTNSLTKRRLTFEALKYNITAIEQVNRFNASRREYDLKKPVELLKNEVFSYIDDLTNEFDISQGEVAHDFSSFLRKNYPSENINIWAIKDIIASENKSQFKKGTDVPTYVAIALYKDKLLKPFMEFYKFKINNK